MSVFEKLTAIADAIREKTESSEKLTLDAMAQKIPGVYENGYWTGEQDGYNQGLVTGEADGRNQAYDEFWDDFQDNGNRTDYVCSFGSGWSSALFRPKYQIKPTKAYMMFFTNNSDYLLIDDFVEFADNLAAEQGKTPETHPDMFDDNGHYMLLDFSECTSGVYALARLHGKHFGLLDFRKCTNLGTLFYSHLNNSYGVNTIDEFRCSEITKFSTDTFHHATKLENITMTGTVAYSINFGACPLSKASITSVINTLSDSVTGQTATFKTTAKEAAFTDEEWKSLIGTKPNWTITLV